MDRKHDFIPHLKVNILKHFHRVRFSGERNKHKESVT